MLISPYLDCFHRAIQISGGVREIRACFESGAERTLGRWQTGQTGPWETIEAG